MTSLWDIRIFLGLVQKETPCISIMETRLKVRSSRSLFHLDFPTNILCAIMIRAICSILFSFWFDQHDNCRRRGRIMKMLTIVLIQPLSLYPNYVQHSPQHPVFEPPEFMFFLYVRLARPTRISRCCSRRHFEREIILTLFLPKLGQNAESILKTYELSSYEDIHYTTVPFCKIGLK